MTNCYCRLSVAVRIALVAVVVLAALGMSSQVLADTRASENSHTPVSTFADRIYTGGVCGIQYRFIFDDDGHAFTVRAGTGGLDTNNMRRGSDDRVRGATLQSPARLNGEVLLDAVYLDSAAGDFVDTGHVYQLIYGTFDDATGHTATLSFQLYDFRPGGDNCTDTLHITRS